MDDLNGLGLLVTEIGVPVLLCLVLIYGIFKLIPTWISTWKASQEADRERLNKEQTAMQAYYDERNKAYGQQMELMNRQAEQQNQLIGQATQVIARSNEVIAANTEAMKQNTLIHEKVQSALSLDLEATREITTLLREHDKQASEIYTTLLRASDKVDRL